MTVNMEQAQTAAKAANNSPEYTAFCRGEATTIRLVNAKLSFDLPERLSNFDVGVHVQS